MLRRFSVDFAVFSMFLDMVLALLSLSFANFIRPHLSPLPFVAELGEPYSVPLPLYLVFPILWVLILQLVSVYDARRNLQFSREVYSLTVGSILAGVTIAGTLYLSYRDMSRVLFVSFAILTYTLLILWRAAYLLTFRGRLSDRMQQRRVLIVGAGQLGCEVWERILAYKRLGLVVVGFLDDDPNKLKKNHNVIGSTLKAREEVLDKLVDDVIIALPPRAYQKVNNLVAVLHDLPVKVWVIPDYFHLALHKATIEEFAGIPMLDLRAPALNDYQRMVKRIFDLVLTLTFLPLALILMGMIALAIRLEGKGPILFRQQRVGENGRLFEMLKFRTMVDHAEELRYLVERFDQDGHLIHKSMHDPRITKVGRFLRQISMDELPQLFNIIKGEMSLVGPRPEMPYLVEKYEGWQRKRFAVPQGLTGWWQVNGRSDKPMHLHSEDDLYYVQNYSLLLDLQILWKTIGVVLQGKGAY
jgi:exopolysaccharide biosynthesis polyprenyl glycosylphosphotransferase